MMDDSALATFKAQAFKELSVKGSRVTFLGFDNEHFKTTI